jgi:A118 family predicted phage portal protein
LDKKIIRLVEDRLLGNEQFSTGANNYKLWLDMYRDESPWVNGSTVVSMGLPASIASELSRLATLEMESEISNHINLNEDYQKVVGDARRFVEYGLALGGTILKPYFRNGSIKVDYATPDLYLILSHDNTGLITHIVFIEELTEGNTIYRRLEEHDCRGEHYIVNNAAFETKFPKSLGKQIELSNVDKWKEIEESVILKNVDAPLFGYFRNPQANNLDLSSPLGISCYSKATSLIQDADEQYSRILWEYEGSELAIDADITALSNAGDLPKGKERLFRGLDIEPADGKQLYEVFSPAIRDESLFNGLNKMLQRIEFVCGLAYGTLSDVQYTTKTAEEIKASKQRSYSTVVDIQKALEESLRELVDAMVVLYKLYIDDNVKDPEISFKFDDSLVVDTKAEQMLRMQEVAAGLRTPEDYIAWRDGISEEEARKKLPKVMEEDLEEDEFE